MSFQQGLQDQKMPSRSRGNRPADSSSTGGSPRKDSFIHSASAPAFAPLNEDYAGDSPKERPCHRTHTQLQKISVFIDGVHLFQAASALGITVDYSKLLKVITQEAQLNEAHFYSVFYRKNAKQAAFFESLEGMGYKVTRKEIGRNSIVSRTIVNFSTDIITDMIAQAAFTDRLIVISGDARLAQARKYVTRQGTSIHLLGLKAITDAQLIEAADLYTDLASIKGDVQLTKVVKGDINSDCRLSA